MNYAEESLKIYAIAELVSDEELRADYILPAAFDPRVKDAVADAAIRVTVHTVLCIYCKVRKKVIQV